MNTIIVNEVCDKEIPVQDSEAAKNKRIDRIITWTCAGIVTGLVVEQAYKLFSTF